MSTPPARPPAPGGGADSPRPAEDALAGLARELDALCRRIDRLAGLPDRVDDLAALVAELTETVTALTARRATTPCPTWLLAPADEPAARRTLDDLAAWLPAVYLRYPDAQQSLPECWCWHPEVVEELLWLMHAWLAAYQGPGASVALVADWHDRQRPGVVRRIRQHAGTCSVENHMDREGRNRYPAEPPQVPGVEGIGPVAAWWGPRRDQAAPEPGPITRRSYR